MVDAEDVRLHAQKSIHLAEPGRQPRPMRILIVDSFYDAVLRDVYAARPGLAHADYTAQWRALMGTFFGTADSYSHYLKPLGHEAHELVANAAPLQRAWAREQGSLTRLRLGPQSARGWRDRVVLAQFEGFRPDVVLLHNLSLLRSRTLDLMRRRSLLVGQIASELPPLERVRAFDLILTSFPHYVDRIARAGTKSAYLRLGFDPRVIDRLGPVPRRVPVAFVGSLRRSQHGLGNALLERAGARVPVEFWGPGADSWPAGSPIVRSHRGHAWGLDMYRVLASARIALNRHIDVAEDHANNMRLYEATGVGTLLVTDRKSNLGDLFDVGTEVVAYRDEDDLVELVQRYLDDEDACRRIAEAGQARTLREHTWAHRMQELVEILEGHV
jgi:hypothetical protein